METDQPIDIQSNPRYDGPSLSRAIDMPYVVVGMLLEYP